MARTASRVWDKISRRAPKSCVPSPGPVRIASEIPPFSYRSSLPSLADLEDSKRERGEADEAQPSSHDQIDLSTAQILLFHRSNSLLPSTVGGRSLKARQR